MQKLRIITNKAKHNNTKDHDINPSSLLFSKAGVRVFWGGKIYFFIVTVLFEKVNYIIN